MNFPAPLSQLHSLHLADQIAAATARVAPTWPLDQFIAVNPYWGWVGSPLPEAAAALGTLAGTRLTMPREWFRELWARGQLQRGHLQAAIEAHFEPAHHAGQTADEALEHLIALLAQSDAPGLHVPRLPLVTDLRNLGAPPRPGVTWSELVTHQISQHCAAYFDRHQASWAMDRSAGLFNSWRQQLAADHGLPWRQSRAELRACLQALPADPPALIAAALDSLRIADEGREAYLSAVLMSIGGWAAWCAYERWQARLAGAQANTAADALVQLLAIRLTWEWLLHDDASMDAMHATAHPNWAARWTESSAAAVALKQAQRADWLLQNAAELAYQTPLIAQLCQATPIAEIKAPAVQAVFCIDVRSEVFRRALEFVNPAVQTRGFAGFFGLPIAYSPVGSALTRPQLPGLLAAAQCVSECQLDASQSEGAGLGQALATQRRNALQWRQRWAEFRAAPSSAFSFVESMGLLYGGKLLKDSWPSTATPARWEDSGLTQQAAKGLRPHLSQTASDPAAAAAMAKGILGAMGLVSGFAPLVLLAGHGSQTANNPHAAGLDCGACGGQTGEVNARVLADLLNAAPVREHLRSLGVDIPKRTHFLPALHITTTDQVQLFDTDVVPGALASELTQLRAWLQSAGDRARAERAASLGLGEVQGAALKQAVLQRANDWAQVRPEWGLVNNAAFIVAPRARTRHINLAGRSFLHDYDHRLDPDLSVLTLILTAPMVVTHWINMQYHASTVDNDRYGSGNKLLHNVVGGHIGVFEGNGGDLRIGLPMQSLHDGHSLRHTPLRLSVFIEAPQAAIDSVIAQHETVRHLVQNGWLHLLRLDPDVQQVARWTRDGWVNATAG